MLRFVPRQCSLFAMRWRTDAADVACWCRTARARKLTTPDQARQCRYLPIVSPRSIDAWGQAASRPAAAMAGMCPGLQRGTYGRSLAARCTASLSLPTDRCDLGTDRQTDRQVRVALCSPAARRGDCVWRFVRRTVSTTASAECCCHNVNLL